MSYNKSLFIFHRSLRLNDNIGLYNALKASNEVIPIFIFTPEQITSVNEYRSLHSLKFMIDALQDLDNQLRKLGSKLYIFYGKQPTIISKILKQDNDFDAVFINKDYTPYAIQREKDIEDVVKKENLALEVYEDCLLHDVNTVLTKSGSFYSVFTPFYNAALNYDVASPIKSIPKKFIKKSYKLDNETDYGFIKKTSSYNSVDLFDFVATRAEAVKRVNNIKNHKNYDNDRDSLPLETTRLSVYIKFGLVSVREIYHKIKTLFGKKHPLIRQLYWREFYFNLSFNRMDILEDSSSFRPSYDNIKWEKSDKLFNLWKNGQTGYPIVDAGMRELNITGYMHNRARLITSNFLVKHLFIDWREGEKYFASKLIDYDPSVNNGNWQFTSGSGADSQPYFRMMNPILQEEKHDPYCAYIKTWVPELADVPNEDIHNWNDPSVHNSYIKKGVKYPVPCKIYDFKKLKSESKKIYHDAFKK